MLSRLFPSDPNRAGIILPGAAYSPDAPLWFVSHILRVNDWTVLQVWDRWDRSIEPAQWARERLKKALEFTGTSPSLFVATKSISTLALPEAAQHHLPGVWLTPLCAQPEIQSGLESITTPTLLVGGTSDPTWDRTVAGGISDVQILEIEEADHALNYPDDSPRSLDALKTGGERSQPVRSPAELTMSVDGFRCPTIGSTWPMCAR